MKNAIASKDEYLKKMELEARAITDLAVDLKNFYLHLENLDRFTQLKLKQKLKLDRDTINRLPLYISEYLRLKPILVKKMFAKQTWKKTLTINDLKFQRKETYNLTITRSQISIFEYQNE